jgi:hypothetical protein
VGSDRFLISALAELAVFAGIEARRGLRFVPGQTDDIAVLRLVIVRRSSEHRMAFLAEAGETTRRHDSISDVAGLFAGHKAIGRAGLFAFDVEDSRAFDLA